AEDRHEAGRGIDQGHRRRRGRSVAVAQYSFGARKTVMKSDRRGFLKASGLVAGAALAGVGGEINPTPAAAQVGTGPSVSAKHEFLGWMRAKAIPIATVQAGNGFADLEQLRHTIGKARIVSLGEATHGTREFFQLKHRLLELCVSELGFTLFGIEAN